MTLSSSVPSPPKNNVALHTAWAQPLEGRPRGLALARESGHVLAWDDVRWLYWFNRAGERQGAVQAPGSVIAACCSDTGQEVAAVGKRGQVWWFAPDLSLRWEASIADSPVAVAIDPFGQYLAVAGKRGEVHIFDRHAHPVGSTSSPRPFHHLAFVAGASYVVGAADLGLVACFDLSGNWLWRDGLVVHIGALAVSGLGDEILLACFTEGLRRYAVNRRGEGRIPVPEACRLVGVSYDGQRMLVAGLGTRLLVLDRTGRVIHAHVLDQPPVALACTALGDGALLALKNGAVVALDLRGLAR